MLYGHGDDFYNAKNEVKINFSSNVWHGANLDKLKEHLIEHFDKLTRYPEPDAATLKRLLARRYEIKEENIVVTNGSITAFYLLAQAWRGAKSMIAIPSFSEYEDACRLHEHEISFFPTSDDLSELSLEGQDFCWICNPNNPDGKLIHRTELLRLISANPQTTFIIDQAYVAFTTEDMLKPSDVKTHKNLILVQSISKAYNIPGLRIGYLVASPEIAEKVNKYIIPWSVCIRAVLLLTCLILAGDLLAGLIYGLPFFLCGIICFTVKHRTGLWCGWAVYACVDLYLRFATGLSWTTVFMTHLWTAQMNYARLAISWAQLLGMFVMLVCTVRSYRTLRLPATKKRSHG